MSTYSYDRTASAYKGDTKDLLRSSEKAWEKVTEALMAVEGAAKALAELRSEASKMDLARNIPEPIIRVEGLLSKANVEVFRAASDSLRFVTDHIPPPGPSADSPFSTMDDKTLDAVIRRLETSPERRKKFEKNPQQMRDEYRRKTPKEQQYLSDRLHQGGRQIL
jgi:hypothetical protein